MRTRQCSSGDLIDARVRGNVRFIDECVRVFGVGQCGRGAVAGLAPSLRLFLASHVFSSQKNRSTEYSQIELFR